MVFNVYKFETYIDKSVLMILMAGTRPQLAKKTRDIVQAEETRVELIWWMSIYCRIRVVDSSFSIGLSGCSSHQPLLAHLIH
jgi:hypothetical protein